MKTISIDQLKQLEASKKEFLLLDVREPDEVAASSLYPGATNIPMGKMFTEAGKGNLPKDVEIIIYCASGARAGLVAQELGARGYTIASVEGGYAALKEKDAH